MRVLSILIIKNGKCSTDIKDIIGDVFNNMSSKSKKIDKLNIKIIHSSKINDEFALNVKNKFDGIIILGGSQSLTNRFETNYKYPYLNKLIDYVRTWIDENIHILGICLGSQIIAEALGHKTKSLNYVEAGYQKNIQLIKDLNDDKLIKPNIYNKLNHVFSLHNDYSDISKKSEIKILGTIKDRNNNDIPYIFKIKNAYGLQFHPETTVNIIKLYNKKLAFDEDIIDYAKEHTKYIDETSKILFTNWLEILAQ